MPLSNWLSDERLEELLSRYYARAHHEDEWTGHLRQLVERAKSQVFNQEAIEELPDDELVARLLDIYRDIVRVPMYYKAIANHPSQVRQALRYLLHSDDGIVTKTNAIRQRDGAHYRKGLGKSFWSLFLMALNPSENPYWNNKTEDALDALGMATWSSSDSPGEVYVKVAEAERALADLHPQADLYRIDHFMHFVTVLEGHEMLQEWRGEPRATPLSEEDWTDRTDEWRWEPIPPERISARKEAEGEARELLESNLGEFDEDLLRRFFDLANSDYYGGQVRGNRFSPAFVGAYANRIVEQLDLFNDWVPRLWQAQESELKELLDFFWEEKPIAYAGTSLPTLILYLRNSERYNIWLGILADGASRLDGPIPSSKDADTYFRYNEVVNNLREMYDWQPQETDIILTRAGRKESLPQKPPVPEPTGAFQGFSPDTFSFLDELRQNNSGEWFDANRERYKRVLREPLRNLFKHVGPTLARFDPNLETDAKYGKVMASIRKRWPDDAGPYHPYLWGAFYQADETKQTDAQLFVIVHPNRLSVGIGAGKGAEDALDLFRENIQAHPRLFYELLEPLLERGLVVTTYRAHGAQEHEVVNVSSPDDIPQLADLDFVDVERFYSPEEDILYRPEFAEEAARLFQDLYPLYLFSVSDDIESDVAPFIEDGTEPVEPEEKYSIDGLQTDTFLDVAFLDEVETLLLDKGQVVFYGPPGTGKTFVAKKFARYFVDKTGGEIRIVQFHPSYAYEEFVEGIQPHSEKGQLTYPIEPGLFRRLCDEARHDLDSRYVLIIDEINRGNLPRIFGELLYLLEYRNETEPVVLPYSKKRFTIPENVYMIGTMNTADRSIAIVDHALRRRFHFVPFKPEPEILLSWLRNQGKETMDWVVDLLRELNHRLSLDQIDWHLHIGHSHWMVPDGQLDERRAQLIWDYSIRPTLEEYFYKSSDRLAHYDYEELKSVVMDEG